MSERVIVRQNSNYEIEFLALDLHSPEPQKEHPVRAVHDLTPYGMLLASIGVCTAILLNSYAQNHGLALQEVEIRLEFARVFEEDCQDCENLDPFEEQIEKEIVLTGELTQQERDRLFVISRQCPIYKMVKEGINIESQMGGGEE